MVSSLESTKGYYNGLFLEFSIKLFSTQRNFLPNFTHYFEVKHFHTFFYNKHCGCNEMFILSRLVVSIEKETVSFHKVMTENCHTNPKEGNRIDNICIDEAM